MNENNSLFCNTWPVWASIVSGFGIILIGIIIQPITCFIFNQELGNIILILSGTIIISIGVISYTINFKIYNESKLWRKELKIEEKWLVLARLKDEREQKEKKGKK